jgi:hypothetical protein
MEFVNLVNNVPEIQNHHFPGKELPGGSNYYWRAGSGNEIIGIETSFPDLPLHWLRQMRIID